jgi:hypothetical protein
MKLHIMSQQVLSAPFSNASNLVIPFDCEIHVHPYTQRKNEIMIFFIVAPCILNSKLVTHQQMHYLLNLV